MKCINRCLSLRNSQVVSDSPLAIEAAIREVCAVADIVVLNAGSSKGAGDWACEVMESIGTMICHQTNHGPGHHSSYAMVDGVPIVGISGPSAGAAVTLGFYLRPLIRAALSLNPAPIVVKATLVEEMPAPRRGGAADIQSEKEKKPAGGRPSPRGHGSDRRVLRAQARELVGFCRGPTGSAPSAWPLGRACGKCRECPVHDAVGRRSGACAGWRSS